VSGLHIFEQYLEVDYKEAKGNYIKLFLPNFQPAENENEAENDFFYRKGSEEEAKFVCSVTEQVEGLIIPTTFKLQLELDRQEETKTVTSLIEAKFKRDETLTATEATALAIHDVTPSNQNNMEQHIKKLIDEAICKKLSKVATTSLSPSTLTPLKKTKKLPWQQETPNFAAKKQRGRRECIIQIPHVGQRQQPGRRRRRGKPTPTNKETKTTKPRTTRTKNPKDYEPEPQQIQKQKRNSRRKEERSKKRKLEKETLQKHTLENQKLKDSLTATEEECIRCYGFVANSSKPIWENIPHALKSIQASTYLNSPSNLHCYNLCTTLTPPTGYNQLLGLGLNYCIEQKNPHLI
jgi:hypothetical protein